MQRSCSLRCRCFVTPGAVSSCKANCTAGDLHRMERARFVIQTVQSIDSTRIGHNAPFQVGILFLFSFILFVHLLLQPSSPGPLLFYFYFCCLPFSLESIFVQCQGTGVNFERNVILTKQERSVGRISGFVRIATPGMHLAFGLNFLLP